MGNSPKNTRADFLQNRASWREVAAAFLQAHPRVRLDSKAYQPFLAAIKAGDPNWARGLLPGR